MKKEMIIWIYAGVLLAVAIIMFYLVFTSSNPVPIMIVAAVVATGLMIQVLRVSRRPR
ncbi:hypothetical protein [Amycolatopsis sp. PS_44_ISF1]|uniref:hypothetical protein n=1 Tax=Amycolatopsis sp. PS_44_ISF1 TaxID=2974917 RepID=UPI0028DF7406|nr:hypothetical protein [Amycolatopsis sp. PS_44_ISF1]MDT8910039.1 hypothetical protein [Amycolatopsis sp. PS_44_ISF1]